VLLDESRIEQRLGDALGVPITIAVESEPIDTRALTATERCRYAEVAGTPRCDSWLRGRAALKRLLWRIGRSLDTSELGFPHPVLSLTHCRRYAVAGAYLSPCPAGMGLDLEIRPGIPVAGARFFLRAEERVRRLSGVTLLRLWTVKEAVFKADTHNAGRGLLDYRLADPKAVVGEARIASEPILPLRYASVAVEGGFLTVAVASPVARSIAQ
jgi:hypothetical protein